jgi:hypothetical protein
MVTQSEQHAVNLGPNLNPGEHELLEVDAADNMHQPLH